MKRRSFVRTAAISAIGLGLNPVITPLSFLQTSGVKHWLQSLVAATSANRRSDAPLANESFSTLTHSLNTYFEKRGFVAYNAGYYFYNDQESCCFYPLRLQHTPSGLNDVLLPVLARNADGTWRHVNTLTGFQLEALARAAKALAAHPAPLQQVLLPAAGPQNNPSYIGFSSQDADIAISTRFKAGKAETAIVVSDQNKLVLFQDTFMSRHSLTIDTAKV